MYSMYVCMYVCMYMQLYVVPPVVALEIDYGFAFEHDLPGTFLLFADGMTQGSKLHSGVGHRVPMETKHSVNKDQ